MSLRNIVATPALQSVCPWSGTVRFGGGDARPGGGGGGVHPVPGDAPHAGESHPEPFAPRAPRARLPVTRVPAQLSHRAGTWLPTEPPGRHHGAGKVHVAQRVSILIVP